MKINHKVFNKRKSWNDIKERYYFVPRFAYSNIRCPNFKYKTISVRFLNSLLWIAFE